MGYTLAQARAFLAAHARIVRRRDALMLALHAVATHGDKAAIERMQQQLLGEDT